MKFNFGYENRANLKALAENLPESAWKLLKRSQRIIKTSERNLSTSSVRLFANVAMFIGNWNTKTWPSSPTGQRRATAVSG